MKRTGMDFCGGRGAVMDLMTIVGIVAGFMLILNGIGMGSIGNFLDISSFLIVAGGTLAAVIASYPPGILLEIPGHLKVLLRGNKYDIEDLVDQIVDMVILARREGLLALEPMAEEIKEPFFRQSLFMVVDAQDSEKIRNVLEKELENSTNRHDRAAGFYERAAAYAPAFGMVGTLIGLINMLRGMNLDIIGTFTLGRDMSLALITTLYGSILANLILNPIAQKLRIRQNQEEVYCTTVIEGVIGIQKGEHPKFLREHLLASLKQSLQDKALTRLEEKDAFRGDESLLGRKRYVFSRSDFEKDKS